ncbi:MAG: YdcF family protein [Casimicrobiaceae bacterium]
MLDDLFWIKPLLKTLVLPPTSLLLLALAGFAASKRFPGVGKMIAGAATLGLLALSLPVVATALSQLLQPPKPFALADAKGAQAIVILGGGARHYAADYGGGDTLAPLTLERVRYGARVARLTGLPILVSGGAPQWGTPEADLMRDALEREYEIPVRWSERQSRNTHQNAVLSAVILRQAQMNRVILVTHGVDMLRAAAEFSAQGIDVVPAATGLSTRHAAALVDWIPGMSALQASYHAVYEIFGNIAMRMALIR